MHTGISVASNGEPETVGLSKQARSLALVELMTAAGLVRRVGTNLNQAVARLNAAAGWPPDSPCPGCGNAGTEAWAGRRNVPERRGSPPRNGTRSTGTRPPSQDRRGTHPLLRHDRSGRRGRCRLGSGRHAVRRSRTAAQPTSAVCRRFLRSRRPRSIRAHPGPQPRRRVTTPHRTDDRAGWEPDRRQHADGHRARGSACSPGRRRRRAAPGPTVCRPSSRGP
jgi:hypothetical protein